MRRFLLLLCAVMLALPPALAQEDEELSLSDVLTEVDPSVAENTLQQSAPEKKAPTPTPSIYEPDGSLLLTISAGGDVELGGPLYQEELTRYADNPAFPMRNLRETLLEDDLTILNLVKAPFAGTIALMQNGADVLTQPQTSTAVHEVKGIPIAVLSYSCLEDAVAVLERLPQDIAAAKAQSSLVIVSFHWGDENSYTPSDEQVLLGHAAVDAGANLVLGHHSKHIQPIESYNGAYICYSLGSFANSAEEKPSDMSSFIFQLRIRIRDGIFTQTDFRILPIRISSRSDRNDFTPTPLDKAVAIDALLTTLKENSKGLAYAVDEYPLEW